MGIFDFLKKKEVVSVKTIIKTESTEKEIVFDKNQRIKSMGFSSIMIIKGFKNDIDLSEIVDFTEHDEISEEAKKLTIDYVNSLKGQIFYSHKKFYKLQESPYKCKDKAKTQVWLYNLIDYELLTIGTTYNDTELIELICKEMPELNTTDKEKLQVIAKDLKTN